MQPGVGGSVVILQTEMRYLLFTLHPAKRVLQFHRLNENGALRMDARRSHRRFEKEREPFLHTTHSGALSEIHKQHDVEYQWRRQNGIPAEKVDLDLHRIAKPA